ncbi:hypothetical protein KAFR_0E01130 [Kazachstania africana CBS 2517]|uniref:Kinase n=1 Tax=Kazachstania africana (strain ATCC 22294 / BCRC 22015 / CBS 2517 / CECT 1963 / NBRC 1671 / NRRL Y-8276) TaxID=1071382 RepID=H2AV67_KAZAF|nr:hypothetical protein KAFR_0E01130 [Kazachstania africana CBS 2517]CCF58267.1 hypothetical protein KAFR_0E01130 [Kazachstania africana CBS 2517]
MEGTQHSKGLVRDQNTMALQDLNASDSGSTDHVLHGRKASTYLRIFRDDDSISSNNPEFTSIRNNSNEDLTSVKEMDFEEELDADENDNINAPSIDFGKYPENELRRNEKSYTKQDQDIFAQMASQAHETDLHRDPIDNDDLSLEPVSSATYYPHKSKSTTKISSNDIELNDVPSDSDTAFLKKIDLDTVIYDNEDKVNGTGENPTITASAFEKKSTNEPKNKEDENAQLADDEGEEEEEVDDDVDDNEYPLAVELQPFTNKVGGHTAIFRFSKRAVCKALMKRENRWYETMEITNNKLLQFMPRYIGVLNVRQHFRSRQDFLNQVPKSALSSTKYIQTNENTVNSEKKSIISQFNDYNKSATSNFAEHKSTCGEQVGSPLEHVHSFTLGEASSPKNKVKGYRNYCNDLLPEVTIDDNKHIIPDSLWGRYANISPVDSFRDDSFLSFKGMSNGETDAAPRGYSNNNTGDNTNDAYQRRDSGSTLLNTKLKDLILQEVFAPICVKKDGMVDCTEIPTRTVSGKYIRKKTRSASTSSNQEVPSTRKDSNASLKELDKQLGSPLMKKSLKESISNAIDASHSVMDLKQFHKKESLRETLSSSKFHKRSRSQHVSAQNLEQCDEEEADTNISRASSFVRADTTPPPESITFEEHTDTIVSKFILLEDLTRHMNKPCALDLKMGTRQYGVDASATKQRSQRSKCLKTTSRKLGVRICGIKLWNQSYYIKRDKYFGRRVKIGWQFVRVLARFLYDGVSTKSIVRQIPRIVKQLDLLATEISNLKGFRLYGASLLLMFDGEPDNKKKQLKIKVNLIDFAKCVTKEDLEEGIRLNQLNIPPHHQELEDVGFVRGIKSLKFYLVNIWKYLAGDLPIPSNDEELKELLEKEHETFDKNWDWLDDFDKEEENEFNDPDSKLRKKWRKYELIFDIEPRYNNDSDISD